MAVFEIEHGVLTGYCPETGETEITIPGGVSGIAGDTFMFCNALEKITLPESIRRIGEAAFYGCLALREINLPDGICSIGEFAFHECTGLTEIRLPEGLEAVSEGLFHGCSALRGITVPESVKTIADSAFSDCTALEEITLHYRIKGMEDGTFSGCPNLRCIRLSPDDPAFFWNYGKVEYLGTEVQNALQMLNEGRYDMKIDRTVKYPFAVLHYMRTGGQGEAYIRRNFTRIAAESTANGDEAFIRHIANTDMFLTRENIDPLITTAQRHNHHRIAALLMSCKHRRFGFSEGTDLL